MLDSLDIQYVCIILPLLLLTILFTDVCIWLPEQLLAVDMNFKIHLYHFNKFRR